MIQSSWPQYLETVIAVLEIMRGVIGLVLDLREMQNDTPEDDGTSSR